MMNRLLLILTLLFLGCNTKKNEVKYLKFNDLPTLVKYKFRSIGSQNVRGILYQCLTTTDNCECKMKSAFNYPFPDANIIVQTCHDLFEFSYGVTAFKYFVVHDSKIYFVKIDTFSYSNDTIVSEIFNIEEGTYLCIDKNT